MHTILAPVIRLGARALGIRLVWPISYCLSRDSAGSLVIHVVYRGRWYADRRDFEAEDRRMMAVIRAGLLDGSETEDDR